MKCPTITKLFQLGDKKKENKWSQLNYVDAWILNAFCERIVYIEKELKKRRGKVKVRNLESLKECRY